jgi:hypothetical protein
MGMDPAISQGGDLETRFAGDGPKGSFSRRGLGVVIAVGRVEGVFGRLAITGSAATSGGRGHPVTRTRGRQ